MAQISRVQSNILGALSASEIAQEVISGLSFGVVLFDSHLRIQERNEAAADLFPADQRVGETLDRLTADGAFRDWTADLREMMDAAVPRDYPDVPCTTPDGVKKLLHLTCLPLIDRTEHRPMGGIMVVEDVTAKAGIEKRLAVSERMAAVGKLAARVAHELNNPLDGILRYVNLSLRQLEANEAEKVVEYLQEARKGLERMTRIVRDLLEFSRSSTSGMEQGDANELVDEALKAMEDAAAQGAVAIERVYQRQGMPALPSGHFFQVFCNLIKNAIDAMPGGGTLIVRTAVTDDHVEISFADTGVGLPGDGDKIFAPFYTTKPRGEGTGLGLAICKEYVEKHHGIIIASNGREGGAVFVVRVPLSRCLPRETRSWESAKAES